jgi:NADH-quinone oxidoreductase subunit M
MAFPILTSLVVLPLAGALVLAFLRDDEESRAAAMAVALIVSVLVFAETLLLWRAFNTSSADFQFVERHAWIPAFGISYFVGVDGISLFLLVLTAFLTPLALLGSWESVRAHTKAFCLFVLLLESAMLGVFISLDLFLFYVFWDAMLIPMYFLIGIWGYDRRVYAAVKFILYTMGASVLMLLAILGLAYLHSTVTGSYSFDVTQLYAMQIPPNLQFWFFLAFALAFAVKVPLFPFHTWLPDAHVEAPTAGSVLLAGVLLKMGTYGLVRFAFPLFPLAAAFFAPYIAVLAIIGIIYGALVAMVQPDMKKLVAYSSVSHLGFVVLGIFSFTQMGLDGAVYQMLNHGISTGALFVLVGFMYERRHSLAISDFGGVATAAPWLSTIFLITTLASIGLPMLNNFVGEFLVLQGTAQANFTWTIFAALGVILSACYMLWMYQRVFFGEVTDEVKHHMPDFNGREWACVVPLVIMMVWMGIGTQDFLPKISETNARILDQSKMNQPLRVAIPAGSPDKRGNLHAR